jgi:lipopolysaccharide export system permease protein
MSILTRHLLRSHAGSFFFALSVLTGLLFLNAVAQRMERLAGKGLGFEVFFDFFMLTIPHVVALTLPMAVLVSVLYTLSELSSGNEISAMAAGGVNPLRLILPLLVAGSLLSALMLYFNDQILPESNHQLQTLTLDIAAKRPTFALREAVVNEVRTGAGSSKYFLQASTIDPTTSELTEVVIHDLADPMQHRTIEAQRGTMAFTPDGTDLILTLFDGTIHQVSDRSPGDYQLIAFKRQTFAMEGVSDELERREGRDRRSDREMTIGMLRQAVTCGREEYQLLQEEVFRRSRYAVEMALLLAPTDDSVDRALREEGGGVERSPECSPPQNVPDPAMDFEGGDPEGADTTTVPPVDSVGADTTLLPRSAGTEGGDTPPPPPLLRPSASQGGSTGGVRFASFTRQYLSDDLTQGVSGNVRTAMLRAQTLGSQEAAYQVEIHKKYAISFACIVFVLFGAPVALRFARGGIGMAIGVSVVVFALYWAGLIGGERLADRGRADPMLAMWAPNLVFMLLSAPLLARMGTVMSTGRGGSGNGILHGVRSVWARVRGRERDGVGVPS